MSLLIVAALLGIAYILMESGLTFFALITFLVAILHALTSQNRASYAGGGHGAAGGPPKQRPVIVTTTGGDIHNPMKIAVKHTWDGSDAYSDFVFYLSHCIAWPFRVISRIITGRPGAIRKSH
ncbi:hypothetical protein HY994_01075 [Candidatus Micrarchaeota archaeon]|nr:hypothetical protein [Candidatus Micrarchaeota archaeon]